MRNLKKANKGAVLPVILLVVVLTQLTFYSVTTIYHAQMELNLLLIKHYQSQTLIALSENHFGTLQGEGIIYYNIGTVKMTPLSNNRLKLTSELSSGYQEEKIIQLPELMD